MNMPAIELGTEAVRMRRISGDRRKIIRTREWTKQQLSELGLCFEDSKSNFYFLPPTKAVPAGELF